MALDLASETNLLQVSHRSGVRVGQLVRVDTKRLQKPGQAAQESAPWRSLGGRTPINNSTHGRLSWPFSRGIKRFARATVIDVNQTKKRVSAAPWASRSSETAAQTAGILPTPDAGESLICPLPCRSGPQSGSDWWWSVGSRTSRSELSAHADRTVPLLNRPTQ
jgi:hypothetical protein